MFTWTSGLRDLLHLSHRLAQVGETTCIPQSSTREMTNNRISNLEFSDERLNRIRRRMNVLRFFLRGARERIEFVNGLINEAVQAGVLPPSVILGRIVQEQPYPPEPGGHESGRIFQAALQLPSGAGLVAWDTERFNELKDIPQALEAECSFNFKQFEELTDAQQTLLSWEIDHLIDLLVRTVPMA